MPKITALGKKLMAIDWKRIGEWVGKLFGGFAKGVKILPTLLPILTGLKGFKLLGPLLGGAKEGGGLFGGIGNLGKGLKGGGAYS